LPEPPGAGHRTGAVAATGPATRTEDTVRGIALMGLAYVVISAGDAAVKWALPAVGTATAMVWRGLVGAACVALIVRGRGLFPRNRRLLLARSLLHTGVSGAWYWAWERGMPLADSYAVACATPLLMTLFAIPMLGEQVGWRRWTSTLLGFAGVLVMLQPSGDLWRIETPVMLAAVVVMAVTRIWTRVLARTDTPAAIAFWLMAAHVPVGLALLPAFPPPSGSLLPPGLGVAVALVAFGAVNAGAHILFGRAFALAPVAVLAPYEYTPLLWGVVLGFLIWAEVPSWTTLAGAAIVVAAGIYNLHRERVRRRTERARGG
jgi:drug/metabolite transporter (DMT)-like permease